jgi:hypothetical protein
MAIQFSEPVDGKYHGEAVVLSGKILHNKKLGAFNIDLPTLLYHKERLTVDYNHEQDLILGYAENFRISDDGPSLLADVYLMEGIPKVQEIITLIKGGTPFEISPAINEEHGILEHDNGVNRYKYVPMRGVAVCPFGTDRFTSLTLLNEETMTKQMQTKTTDLSDETASGESQEPKVKDPDLAEFISVYGTEKGLELWQSGADIGDIRQLKELIEKYGVPGPPATETTATTELNEEEEEPAKPAEEKKDEEKTTTELKAAITALKAEVTKLHAALPRGENAPVKHSYTQEESKKELSEKEQYIQSFDKRFSKQ